MRRNAASVSNFPSLSLQVSPKFPRRKVISNKAWPGTKRGARSICDFDESRLRDRAGIQATSSHAVIFIRLASLRLLLINSHQWRDAHQSSLGHTFCENAIAPTTLTELSSMAIYIPRWWSMHTFSSSGVLEKIERERRRCVYDASLIDHMRDCARSCHQIQLSVRSTS